MKRSEIKKLKEKTLEELQKELIASRESLRTLRFELASGKVKNSAAVREMRRKIARLLGFIREKERAAEKDKTKV